MDTLRPEALVRMRGQVVGTLGIAQSGPGTALGIPRIPTHAQSAQVMPARVGVASLGALLGYSEQNMFKTRLELRITKLLENDIRIGTIIIRNSNLLIYNTIL